MCIENLQEDISLDSCLRTWFMCDQLDIHPLAEKAKCKALMDFKKLRETDTILGLNIKELHMYLSNTFLHCDNELDVFESGMKWWYDFSKKDICDKEEKTAQETKYLLVILRCLNYTEMCKADIDNMFLIAPDISEIPFIKNLLTTIGSLMQGEQVSDETEEERMAVEFYINCRKRKLMYLPCVVCHEYENIDKPKRQKYMNCNCLKTVNVYYFGRVFNDS